MSSNNNNTMMTSSSSSTNSVDLGIYFGGSSLSVAYCKDGNPTIIVNEAGDRSTPALVAVNDNEFSIGLPAKQNLIRNSKNTVPFVKHFIHKTSTSQLDPHLLQRIECTINDNGPESELSFKLEKNEKDYDLSVSEAIEKQFKYLNDLTRTSLSVKECDAVLGVPLHFTPLQSKCLVDCASKAGFKVLRVIKNHVAACLAYNLEEDNTKDSLSLIYQMGGNSVEISIIAISNGLLRIVDSCYLPNLGGDLFTDVVVDTLCEEFQRKHKSNPKNNKRSVYKLKSNAEELKCILSTMDRAHCSIDALYDGIDFDFHLNRQRFDTASNKLYQQILEPIDQLLIKSQLSQSQIDNVILCGAATKMCKLQSLVKQMFPSSKMLNHLSPDEIVAIGCAKQCSIIKASRMDAEIDEQDRLFKSLALPIYLKNGMSGDELQLVFAAKTPLPVKKNIQIETINNEPFLFIMESNDCCLAKISLDSFKTKDLQVFFQIKLDETVEVTVTETSTNQKISVFLNSDSSTES